jgi:hypothetical protein
MKRFTITILLGFCFAAAYSQKTGPSKEIQIKTALMAAPADKRDSAAVFSYTDASGLVELKKGQNELMCLVDDPSKPSVSVSCYHRDLEPFMARGRTLRKEGKNTAEIFDIREKEVKAGQLKMPEEPTTLFVYSGKDENYDHATGELKDGYLRYVIYIPYATPQSTGLPLRAGAPGMPWIMHPGTHGAHIMINPAPAVKNP